MRFYFFIADFYKIMYNTFGDLMKKYLEVGKIINTHGIKGEMKLDLWCDSIDYLKQFKTLYFDENGENPAELLSVRAQKNNAIIKLSGVNSIDEAEKLKGTVLYSNRDDAEIEEGANYIQDIIGCYVVDYESEREYGRVVDVVNYGASDILEIENGGKRFYVPVIPDIIMETDIEYQVIRIKAMKGLFDED